MPSPTEKTVKLLRSLNFHVERVEQDRRFPEAGSLTKREVLARIDNEIASLRKKDEVPIDAGMMVMVLNGLREAVEQCDRMKFWKQDLGNIADHLVVGNGRTILVQTTDSTNVSAHIKKIQEAPFTRTWLEKSGGGELCLIGWYSGQAKKMPRVVAWVNGEPTETACLKWLVGTKEEAIV